MNSDNFDYISPLEESAIEITCVIPQNEINAYIYEKLKYKKKLNLKTKHIKELKLKTNGNISYYYGGSIKEIKNKIYNSLETKNKKALNRLKNRPYKYVDLCLCIQDGSLFDLSTFELNFNDLYKYIFQNIFFITPSHFIVYNNDYGFKEFPRLIS